MPWADWARRWVVYALAGALIAPLGPASPGRGTPAWAVMGKVASADAGVSHGRRPVKPSGPAVSIAARLVHVAGGRKAPRQNTCPATVTLSVTIFYRKP